MTGKEVKPPFVPQIKSEIDVRNFDKIFTSEKVHDTPEFVNPHITTKGNSYSSYSDFTYNGSDFDSEASLKEGLFTKENSKEN